MTGRNSVAASATLHCLTGCAIGEILGLMIGTAMGLSNVMTLVLAVGLAFLFGYSLSTLPLIQAGASFGAALSVVFAADTLSIAVMELVDNLVMFAIPGAMEAGLVNPIFWIGMILALSAAFVAAFPVNRYLIDKGKGHALTHKFHEGHSDEHATHEHSAHRKHDHANEEDHATAPDHTECKDGTCSHHQTDDAGDGHAHGH